MRAGFGVMAVVVVAVAGCARGPAADCTRSETLVDQGDDVVVFVNDCDGGFVRPATPADLARLEAPLQPAVRRMGRGMAPSAGSGASAG